MAANLAASLRGIAASNMRENFGEFLMSSPNGFGIFFSKRVFLNIFWNFDAETGYRIQDEGCRIQDTGYNIEDTGYRIHHTGYRIQHTGYKIQDTG